MSTTIPFIRSRYEQYKRDTRQFTTWLAQTAISLGYPISKFDLGVYEDVEETVQTVKSKKNAKKKARAKEKVKSAQQASSAPHGNSSSGPALDETRHQNKPTTAANQEKSGDEGDKGEDVSGPTVTSGATPSGPQNTNASAGRYTLKLSLYVEVAQYIVDRGAIIPVEVIRILKRCINLRTKAARRFAATSDNESHLYFIDILNQLRRLLEHCNFPSNHTDSIPLTNQFSGLPARELEEDAEDIPDIQLPGVASSTSHTTFEPEMSLAEAINAIIIFLGDMEDTRLYIQALWQDYKSGSVDLVTAAVTTNTALELMKKPHDSLMQRVMPTFDNDFTVMICAIFSIFRERKAGESPAIPLYHQVDDRDHELGLFYDFTMLPIIQSLTGLAKLINNDTIPVYNGQWGLYDPDGPFDELSCRQRWQQYIILLAELFTDMFFLLGLGRPDLGPHLDQAFPELGSLQGGNTFFVDETMRLVDNFMRTKDISFHLAFALRILMDINLTLGPATGRGIRHLHDTANRMVRTLESRSSVEGPDPPADWDARNERIIARFVHEASFLAKFDLRLLKQAPGMEDARLLLLDRDPLLCGLLLFRLQMLYQDIGFKLANTWGSILYASHLYEACVHSGGMPGKQPLPSWPDMELVLEIHNKEQAFGGKIPTNLDESQSAFLLIAGYSTDVINAYRVACTDAARQYRPPPNPEIMSSSGPRPFKDQTKILPMYRRKYTVDVTTGLQYDIVSIEGLLVDLNAREAKESTSSEKRAGRKGYRKPKKHRAAKFSLIQLLSVLEKGLQEETTSIRFDYVSMHLRCLQIFRNIKRVSHSYLSGKHGPAYIENDSQLPFITAWILHIATLALRQGEQSSGIKRSSGITKSRLLSNATDEFRTALKSNGAGGEESRKVETDRKR